MMTIDEAKQFTKKTEKTPITELKHAKELREEWFTNDD